MQKVVYPPNFHSKGGLALHNSNLGDSTNEGEALEISNNSMRVHKSPKIEHKLQVMLPRKLQQRRELKILHNEQSKQEEHV